MKKISILGSTGSIGTQTLEIVSENTDFQVVALAANSNVELMEQQIRMYKPILASMTDENAAKELREKVRDLPVRIVCGMEGLIETATIEEADVVVTAIVGMIGIEPTVAAIKAHKTIALANKETLVTAGHIIMPLAAENNVAILPVDSEHSAIFQSLNGENKNRMSKILLTASGGPFRGMSAKELKDVTLEMALRHPNWTMGKKITIDSATLVNKGLEMMEARWLFGTDYDKIQVVVHPQSIIHSMVEFVDGGIIAQLGEPDMKLPIQYALTYPDRRPMQGKRVNFFELKQITFEEPDLETFLGLKLAYRAAKEGGIMPTLYNAANEKAVALFLAKKISFIDIPAIIQDTMNHFDNIPDPDVKQILCMENKVYEYINDIFRIK